MNIIINHTSMIPIYEQIIEFKSLIRTQNLQSGDTLLSVCTWFKERKIRALTVKKAYDYLEAKGFTVTMHGKGSYTAVINIDTFSHISQLSLMTWIVIIKMGDLLIYFCSYHISLSIVLAKDF